MSVTLLLDAGTLACYQQSPEGYTSPGVKLLPHMGFSIDHRISADTLKVIADLQLDSRPQAILKLRPPNSLDYSTRHGCQPR